jgi:dTDP-D-glucose 4,6-dehydratase
MKKTILITGGAGFIGSHVVRRFINRYPDYLIVNGDKLTYAGNLENLTDIEQKPNYIFEKIDTPLRGSSPNLPLTSPLSPSNPIRMSVGTL